MARLMHCVRCSDLVHQMRLGQRPCGTAPCSTSCYCTKPAPDGLGSGLGLSVYCLLLSSLLALATPTCSHTVPFMPQVCCALSQIAKHSVDLAEVVVGAEIFPKILTCLKFPDEFVKKHSATVVREVAKHTPELAQLVVGNGGVGALVDYISE